MLVNRRVRGRVIEDSNEFRGRNQGNRPTLRAVEREREGP